MKLTKAASVAARSLAPYRPHHVQWLITRKCNYRCKGCNVWNEQDKNELTTTEIKKGLDILRKLGIVEVVFHDPIPTLQMTLEDRDRLMQATRQSIASALE